MSISFDLFPDSQVASTVAIETAKKKNSTAGVTIPQTIGLFGQYNSGKTPVDNVPVLVLSADDSANLFGFGSMLHLQHLKIEEGAGNAIPVYAFPLADDGAGVAATGTITFTTNATSAGVYSFYVAGQKIQFTVVNGDTPTILGDKFKAAHDAILNLPTTAASVTGVVTLTSKWLGTTANEITIKQNLAGKSESDQVPTGTTVAIVAMASGANNPDVATALGNLGDTWFTMLVWPYRDSSNLDVLENTGDDRFAPIIQKPFLAVIGSELAQSPYLSEVGARNSSWSNFINVPSLNETAFELAANAVGEMAFSAQVDPARPFKTLELTGISTENDSDPYDGNVKNSFVQAGGGYTNIDSVGGVRIGDMVSTLTETALGAPSGQWWTVDTTNVQAKIYTLDVLFKSPPFDRAIVVDDAAVTTKGYAISPKRAKAVVKSLVDQQWIPEAWSKDRDFIVQSITAEIDPGNAGRINIQLNDVLAKGLRIIAIKYFFSDEAGKVG
jgi:phage tail sheath gpL-like